MVKDIGDLGIGGVTGARVVDIYWLDADLADENLDLIGKAVLFDPVTQEYRVFNGPEGQVHAGKGTHTIEVAYNPGVADPVEETVMLAVRDLGIRGVKMVKTTRRYLLQGRLSSKELDPISARLLVNPIIQHVLEPGQFSFPSNPRYCFKLREIDLLGLDAAGQATVRRQFGFSDDELGAIVAYYYKQGRNPTDIEIETLAQTWSEHCVHKTFRGKISFNGAAVDNLLKSTIAKATNQLDKSWCVSVFEDNAGGYRLRREVGALFQSGDPQPSLRRGALWRGGYRGGGSSPGPPGHRTRGKADSQHRRLLLRAARPSQ